MYNRFTGSQLDDLQENGKRRMGRNYSDLQYLCVMSGIIWKWMEMFTAVNSSL